MNSEFRNRLYLAIPKLPGTRRPRKYYAIHHSLLSAGNGVAPLKKSNQLGGAFQPKTF
jgi:hypothetical protein